jgi:aminoglycoside phosphotransferase (APT) family kinase protein
MNATSWAKEQFVQVSGLDRPEPAPKPYDGLDQLLLFSWIRRKLSDTDAQPFVWQYWDLRPPNIMLDEENNLIACVALKFSS